jgi:serine/threonine protein kinase/ketosteroid isomerase-like protein
MKVCTVCQRCYEDAVADCEENHGSLAAARSGSREMIANYRLDFLLERDATGETYQATRSGFDQFFIIKIFALNSTSDSAEREKIQSEARAAANLNHLNVARVYEFGSTDSGEFYTVTESISGQTLRECLRKVGVFPEAEAVMIARHAAEALEAAHRGGVIHRAVSPANIILAQDGEKLAVKLQNFDFGGVTQQSIVAASSDAVPPIDALRYLSPEQCAGQAADARSDVYSLAVVLFEMLCGRSPFDAPTSAVIADRRINVQPLEKLSFDTRALLKHVLQQSLQNRPEARPQTAGNFARQLSHIEQLLNLSPAMPPRETSKSATSDESAPDAVVVSGTSTPESSKSPFEKTEKSRTREFSTQETSESLSPSMPAVASSVENVEEKSVYADTAFPEPETIRIEKREERVDSVSAEPVSAEPILIEEASVTSFESEPIHIKKKFESEPILVRKKQFDASADESEPVLVEWKNTDVLSTASEVFELSDVDVKETRKKTREAQSNAPILTDSVNESRAQPLPVRRSLLVGASLLALLVSVMLGALLYKRQHQSAVASPTIVAASQPQESALDKSDDMTESGAVETAATQSEETTPNAIENPSQTTAKREDQPGEETAANAEAAKQNEPLRDRIAPENPATAEIGDGNNRARVVSENGDAQAELNTSLGDWITATNARNVDRQMNYYAPKVTAYYRTRNVSPDAVRAEKRRAFERADTVNIQTGKPEISVSPDGKSATMRFRKKYVIKEGQQTRNGEVIQELRWVKSGGAWRIVSERDVKVINR